jgi:hypothetical protein
VISSRRGDQIPDPGVEATLGIAPSDPLAAVFSSTTPSRVLRRASKFAAPEDDDDDDSACNPPKEAAVGRGGGAASRDGEEEEEALRRDGVKAVEGEGRRRRPYAFLTVAFRDLII